MAFLSKSNGPRISYDSEELIYKLQDDIDKFGENFFVDVEVELIDGIAIYKNYTIADDKTESSTLNKRRMSCMALMTAYKIQDSVL